MGLYRIGLVGAALASACPLAAQIGAGAPITNKTFMLDTPRLRELRDLAVVVKPVTGMTRAAYVEQLRQAFIKRDLNQDRLTAWQAPATKETLAAFKKCVIVKYQSTPASITKDTANPGKFIQTPATTVPVDWEYLLEQLAGTKVQGKECQSFQKKTVKSCSQNGQKLVKFVGYLPIGQFFAFKGSPGLCMIFANQDLPGCKNAPYKQACALANGTYAESVETTSTCENFAEYGPHTDKALVRVAEASFDAEDWNKNGVINGDEGQFLCPAG